MYFNVFLIKPVWVNGNLGVERHQRGVKPNPPIPRQIEHWSLVFFTTEKQKSYMHACKQILTQPSMIQIPSMNFSLCLVIQQNTTNQYFDGTPYPTEFTLADELDTDQDSTNKCNHFDRLTNIGEIASILTKRLLKFYVSVSDGKLISWENEFAVAIHKRMVHLALPGFYFIFFEIQFVIGSIYGVLV